VDQGVRDEVSAAVGAHAELGNDYSHPVAEGLIERIGTEIDKRVDARLAEQATRNAARPAPRSSVGAIVVPLGTVGMGLLASGFTMVSNMSVGAVTTSPPSTGAVRFSTSGTQLLVLAIIWAVIAVVNVAYARRR
jgi:hypothetical protein